MLKTQKPYVNIALQFTKCHPKVTPFSGAFLKTFEKFPC